jgi:polyhydroxyalkanoate synthesis regulator phasin
MGSDTKERAVLDDLRSYVQMASGLTEATASKAKDVVTALLSQGMSLSSKAMPAPEMMGQVQELADDLVNTSRNNREMLVGMIRAEVDRAVGRMGFVREDELAALRRHVQRLEKQLADLESASAATRTYPAQTYPAQTYPAQTDAAQPPVESTTEGTTAAEVVPEVPDPAADPATDQVPVKKKKKKIIVDESAGS